MSLIIKDYERDKIYRLNRRMSALYNLLSTLDNSQIDFENLEKFEDLKDSENNFLNLKTKEDLKQKIRKDIDDCEKRMHNWWTIISKRYNLQDKNQDISNFQVNIYTGELCEIQN